MTKDEAIEAMKNGERVRHMWFSRDEWMESTESGKSYNFEDGVVCRAEEFWLYRNYIGWDAGWSIVPQ